MFRISKPPPSATRPSLRRDERLAPGRMRGGRSKGGTACLSILPLPRRARIRRSSWGAILDAIDEGWEPGVNGNDPKGEIGVTATGAGVVHVPEDVLDACVLKA